MKDELFVGWAAGPSRRMVLGAAGLAMAGAGLGALLGAAQTPPGDGVWNQGDVRDWVGVLAHAPYPMLRTTVNGAPRTAFLASTGKTGVQERLVGIEGGVRVRASLIARGDHAMLAVADSADAIAPAQVALLPEAPATVIGEATLTGEILDAKCWFGAMRPGFGKTHKACAALCAHGRLPLAFCVGDACVKGGMAPLFLTRAGAAHGAGILPFVADAVMATGLLVQAGDIRQFRVDLADIRRL